MNLHEYQGKSILKSFGVKIQEGKVAASAAEAVEVAKQLQEEGHFQQGSMWPKIRSAIHFLKHHGEKAVITNIANIQKAIEGKAGTTIVKD